MSSTSAAAIHLTVPFGKTQLTTQSIFLLRKNVFCTVNFKPVVQGHVIVATRRQAKRLAELTEVETLDLWTTAQQVSRVIEQIYKAPCQVVVQDGLQAGSQVEQVHLHVVPRYADSDETNAPFVIDTSDQEARTLEDMQKEADKYRSYFEQGFQQ